MIQYINARTEKEQHFLFNHFTWTFTSGSLNFNGWKNKILLVNVGLFHVKKRLRGERWRNGPTGSPAGPVRLSWLKCRAAGVSCTMSRKHSLIQLLCRNAEALPEKIFYYVKKGHQGFNFQTWKSSDPQYVLNEGNRIFYWGKIDYLKAFLCSKECMLHNAFQTTLSN